MLVIDATLLADAVNAMGATSSPEERDRTAIAHARLIMHKNPRSAVLGHVIDALFAEYFTRYELEA